MKKFSLYATYLLKSKDSYDSGYGYTDSIHCNYINRVDLDEIGFDELILYFNNVDVFKFLSVSGGTGFTANEVFLLLQIVENEPIISDTANIGGYRLNDPESDKWRIFEVTDQIEDHTTGDTITVEAMGTSVFKFPFTQYNSLPFYDLEYLNYPGQGETDMLSFGGEQFFFGNVDAEVEAIAHTMDLPITLPINEFNTSTNKTWDEGFDVFVSEIGLFDDDNNLLAVGKLNNPIRKNSGISRTIIFGIDF